MFFLYPSDICNAEKRISLLGEKKKKKANKHAHTQKKGFSHSLVEEIIRKSQNFMYVVGLLF